MRDHGIGVKDEDRTAIFEPFRRASATRDTIPGVGLGLFTARKIAEAHGGTIEVDGASGGGSVFTFALPLAGEATASAPVARPATPSGADAHLH